MQNFFFKFLSPEWGVCKNLSQVKGFWMKKLVAQGGYDGNPAKLMSVPDKNFDSQPSSVFKLFLLPSSSCYGLDIT